MKSQHIIAATLGALLAMPAFARAADTTTGSGTSALSTSDKDFITKAAQGGMTEIDTSKLAKKTSSNDSIKAFAQEMIEDHKKANNQLKKIAKGLNVTVAKDEDAEHQGEIDQLKSARSADFDQKYIAIQDKEHNDAVTAFQQEADSGDNQQLKEFAAKTLPALKMHLEKVQELKGKVPPSTTSSQK